MAVAVTVTTPVMAATVVTESMVGRAKITATVAVVRRGGSNCRNDSDGNGGTVSDCGNGSNGDEGMDYCNRSNGSNGRDTGNGSDNKQ